MDKEIQECIFKKLLNLISESNTDSDDEDSLRMMFNGLSKSPYLTLNCLEELFLSEKFPDIDLSKINQLNPKDSIPWDWGEWGISKNPNITMEFIEKYPDKPWRELSRLEFKKERERFLLDKYHQYIEKMEKKWRVLFDFHSHHLPLELAHMIVVYAGL